MTTNPFRLTTDAEREAGFELADDLFEMIMRLNDGDFAPLATQMHHPDSVYHHVTSALDAVFRQLGVPPEDIPTVQNHMGDGSPTEEAIEIVRSEKES